MIEINKDALINQLVSMRASIDACLYMLKEEEEGCNHPKEFRIDYTTMGGKEHWKCQKCGFEYIEGEDDKDGNVR